VGGSGVGLFVGWLVGWLLLVWKRGKKEKEKLLFVVVVV